MSAGKRRLQEAKSVLVDLGFPRSQCNDRTALCLLALLDLSPTTSWGEAQCPLVGITPIMEWVRRRYRVKYAPNTRETIRRQSMHQFVEAGIALYNPDKPDRPTNSPNVVYQIEPTLLLVLKSFSTNEYRIRLESYLGQRQTLTDMYARARQMNLVPVSTADGKQFQLSPGKHSTLIKAIVEEFGQRFAPGGELVYVGDTADKFGYFDQEIVARLGVSLNRHGKMPDVVIYFRDRNWLLLVESVTSRGPIDGKRHAELSELFSNSSAGLVFVSAFPDRRVFLRHLEVIAWETEVWIAAAPSHMIHFDGIRFLGPYGKSRS